jgi:hypothetical protein
MPSPKKIKTIPIEIPENPIQIPENWGFAKITNKKAPIKRGILRIFLNRDVFLLSITSSLLH